MRHWIFISVIGMILILAGNLSAIERKEAPPTKPAQVEAEREKSEPRQAVPNNLTEPKRKTKPKQAGYDDFVDKNNNGIDDRTEVKKEKIPVEKKNIPPSSASKKKGEKK